MELPPVNKSTWLWLGVILLLTTISYSPVFEADFVNWDDEVYVLNNEYIHELSGENVTHFLTQPIGGIYQPLTMLSLALEYSLVGAEAKLFHVNNLILHLLNTLLVFFFIRRLIGKINVALMVASLFALHTLHVESVAWVTERKDVLYTFFYLLSLIQYLKYIGHKKPSNLALTGFFFLLAILAKPAAVVLAAVYPLLDWYKGRKLLDKKVILEKLPFLAVAIFFGWKLIQDQVGIQAIDFMENQGLGRHLVFAGYSFVMYIFKTVLPIQLSTIYPVPAEPGEPIGAYYWAVTIIGVLSFLYALWHFRKNKLVLFCLLFFAGNVVLMLQIVPAGYAYQADRFTYIPTIGLFLIMAHIINRALEKKSNYGLIGGFGVYVIVLAVLTNQQAKTWESSLTLWDNVIEKYDNVYIPYSNRGYFRYQIGDYTGAMEDFNKALEIRENGQAYVNRGNLYQSLGQPEQALADFNKAVELSPNYADAYVNRGVVEMSLLMDSAAIADFDRALEIFPEHELAYSNKGSALYNLNQYAEAIPVLSAAIEYGGENANNYCIRGLCYFAERNDTLAIRDFQTVLALTPDNSLAYSSMGAAFRNLRSYDQAIAALDAAISLEPGNANSHNIRGLCYAETGDYATACIDFEKAASFGSQNALGNLAKFCQSTTTPDSLQSPTP